MTQPASQRARESAELKPCPFCGSTLLSHWQSNSKDSLVAMEAPVCECGAQGPMYPTRAEAIAAWNTRAPDRTGYAAGIEAAAKWHDEQAAIRTRLLPTAQTIEMKAAYEDGQNQHRAFAYAIRALAATPPEAISERKGDDNGLSEYMHGVEDKSPTAAASRVRAFLDWKGTHIGEAGPRLYFGDLRILADAAAPPAPAIELDNLTAAVTALARHNIPTDIQELLLTGNPERGIAPGALKAALSATVPAPAIEDEDVERVARALYDHWRHNEILEDTVDWARLPGKEDWRERARAALASMSRAQAQG